LTRREKPRPVPGGFEKPPPRSSYTKVLARHNAKLFYFFFDGTFANRYILLLELVDRH
jgi:hypothetical protein